MRRTFIVSLVFALFVVSPASATCFWIDHIDTDPTYFCTSAQYYTVLTSEPDWCDYQYGDWVFLRSGVVNGYLVITGYYIVPASDPTALPPSSFSQYHDAAVGENCTLIYLPF